MVHTCCSMNCSLYILLRVHENAKLFKRRFVPIWGLRGDQHLVRKYTCKYIFRYRVWPTNHSCRHAYAKHVYHQKNYQTYRVLMSYIHTRTCGFERKIEIYTCSVCYASTGKTRKEPQGQGPRGQHTVTDCHEGQPSLGVGGSTRMSREDMHGEIRDKVPAGDLTRWLAHARPPGARELAL